MNPLRKYIIFNCYLGYLTKMLYFPMRKYYLDNLMSIDARHTVTQSVPQRFCHASRHQMYFPPTVRCGVATLQGELDRYPAIDG